jgi:hypothetical protein
MSRYRLTAMFSVFAIMTLGTVAGPVLGGQLTAAGAATAVAGPAQHATASPANSSYYYLRSYYDGAYVDDPDSAGGYVFTYAGGYTFRQTGANGKYWELQSSDGYCLQYDHAGGNLVRDATCNGDASELWWIVRETGSPYSSSYWYEFINDYGTSVMHHDACMWNPDPNNSGTAYGHNIIVQDCAASQPQQQVWAFSTT